MKRTVTIATLSLAAALSARPAEAVMPYTPHRCVDDAKRQALTLLQARAKGAGRVALANEMVLQKGTVDPPNARGVYARLEVRGFIGGAGHIVTLIYPQSPGPCVPYGPGTIARTP